MKRKLLLLIVCATLICGNPVSGADGDYDRISFASANTSGATINGLAFRPNGRGPFGAVIGMHGCNGLFEDDGVAVAHYVYWARQLRDAGYLVLLIDSLGSRGIGSLCTSRSPSPIKRDDLSGDAFGALMYIRKREDVDPAAIAIIGWSMGADTVLNTISGSSRTRPTDLGTDFSAAIVFYPSCSFLERNTRWMPVVPLLFQLGAADQSTPPQPCVALFEKARAGGATVDFDLYPDAYHLFDHPEMVLHPYSAIVYRDGSSPMIGANVIARAAAIARVKSYLQQNLKIEKRWQPKESN